MKKMTCDKTIIKMFVSLLLAVMLILCLPGVDAATKKPAKGKTPTLSAKTDKTITVKWKAAKYAKKYQLAYKIKGGKWKYKKTKSKKLKVSSLKSYKYYYFKVRGINGKKYGKWSKSKKIQTYKTPSAVTFAFPSKRTKDTVEMTWKNVSGIKTYSLSFTLSDGTTSTKKVSASSDEYTTYIYPNAIAENSQVTFKVRSVKANKYGTVYSSWKTVKTKTLKGANEIIGAPYDNSIGLVVNYTMTEPFKLGEDNDLIPLGHQTMVDNTGQENHITDRLYVNTLIVPEGAMYKDLANKELSVGDTFNGHVVKKIQLSIHEIDVNDLGWDESVFDLYVLFEGYAEPYYLYLY